MLKPAPLTAIPSYPVTASVSAAAIAVTIMWWMKQDVGDFFMDGRVWSNWEWWRALSATLPHVNFFHLAFNLYWFWTFGTLLEQVYGHFKFAGIILLLALGSMLAEFDLFSGGVGLSGVGYGLWGMLWVLEKRDHRFHDAVDPQTSQTFIGWFFLCIILTVTNVMPVANVAHGVGAVMGALLGWAVGDEAALKQKGRAGLVILMILIVLGATVFWPAINLGGNAEPEVEQAGLDAMKKGDYPKALRFLEISTTMRQAPARAWYNLGIAYQRAQRFDEAMAAFDHAAQMPDSDSDMQKTAADMKELAAIRSNLHPPPKQNFETNAGAINPMAQTNR